VKGGILRILFLLLCIAPGQSFAADDNESIAAAVEKARARESAFDGVDVRFSYDLGIGGHPAAFSGRFVKQGQRFLMETIEKGEEAGTAFAQASDGFIERRFVEESAGRTGEIYYPSPASYDSAAAWSAPCMAGVTHTMYGKVSDILSGGHAGETRIFKDGSLEGVTNKVRRLDPATIDGHTCNVFEIERTTGLSGKHTLTRLYLAEDLGGACVRAEYESVNTDGERITRVWSFGDLREISPGLYVAFSSHSETANAKAEILSVIDARIDSFEFPSAFDPQLFSPEFPAGTQVTDRRPDDEKEAVTQAVLPVAALGDAPETPQGGPASPTAVDKPQTMSAPLEGPEKTPPRRRKSGALLAVLIAVFCMAAVLIAKRKRRRT